MPDKLGQQVAYLPALTAESAGDSLFQQADFFPHDDL